MIPAGGLTYYYTSTRGTTQNPGSWTLSRLWQYFIRNESLAYHSKSQLTIAWLITGAFLVLFFYTFIRDLFITRDWHFGLRVHRKDLLLVLCVAFFIVYLKAPDGMSGGGFIKTRLSFLPFLIIIPWLSWDMPKVARAITGIVLIILTSVYIVHASYYHKMLSDDMKIYTSGYSAIEPNKVVLPLAFNRVGKGWRIGAFLHSVGHYGYTRGCIELDNYEASTNYFPTYFKPDLHRPQLSTIESKPGEVDFNEYKDDVDYIITWGLASRSAAESAILNHYEIIRQNDNLKIFRRLSQ